MRKKNILSSNHIHRYEKVTLGKNYKVYRCNLPGCSHYVRRELAKGRISLCNRCNKEMILDAFTMQFAKPHCAECTDTKKAIRSKILELVEAHDSSVPRE